MLRLAFVLLAISTAAHAQTLLGRATLPAATFRAGPTSGTKIQSANGVAVPFENKQPVGGFSSLQRAPGGDLWALADNGYGTKANSPDFELCITRLGRDFKTKSGGSGKLIPKQTIYLRDPNRKAGFAIVNENTEERRLTGADFDPESLVVMPNGDFWIGEEFGPFLLHFSSEGALLGAPDKIEDAPFSDQSVARVASPDDPLGRPANIKRSKGFEGLARSLNPDILYAMLEGPILTSDARTLVIYAFDIKQHYSPAYCIYQLEDPSHSIGELAHLTETTYLVIERDNLQGDATNFKKIYEVDFNVTDPNGFLEKRERADLLQIQDPDHLASQGTFRFPFQTIESVLPLDNERVIVMNDNNYPFSSGRKPGQPEDTEAIVIRLKP